MTEALVDIDNRNMHFKELNLLKSNYLTVI